MKVMGLLPIVTDSKTDLTQQELVIYDTTEYCC